MAQNRIVTLLTDFGGADYYVGAMKGVILNINPEATIIDITHELIPHDILDAAFTLAQTYRYYPPRTIHLVVVDPGVGTQRRPILAVGDNHYFIAPDNGVLSFIYGQQERVAVREISAHHYFLSPVSQTFHARDVFAPVAAYLSKGLEPNQFGEEITDFVRLQMPKTQALNAKSFKGIVLKVDRFGNAITNISAGDVPALFEEAPPAFKLKAGQQEISKLVRAYAEGAQNEVFAILGSSGYLELATNRGGAAKLLGVTRGAEVILELS
ncbi:MAG: SAM-dependent chlorinase/fluorinase [Acidobacteria bacterium]|nr:SAM-dependent chlorinase/fluorinase [Acidobacteriota bacterium]